MEDYRGPDILCYQRKTEANTEENRCNRQLPDVKQIRKLNNKWSSNMSVVCYTVAIATDV